GNPENSGYIAANGCGDDRRQESALEQRSGRVALGTDLPEPGAGRTAAAHAGPRRAIRACRIGTGRGQCCHVVPAGPLRLVESQAATGRGFPAACPDTSVSCPAPVALVG